MLSPDGSTVAFSDDQSPLSSIYTVPATGGVPKKICDACGRPVDWLPDRSKILVDDAGPKQRDIHILDVATGQSKPLLQHPDFRADDAAAVAGRARAGVQPERGEGRARRIYLVPFTGEPVPESQWSLIVDGTDFDRQPVWSPSGDMIYFQSDRDGTRCIWAQRVDTSTRKAVGEPFAAHHIHQLRLLPERHRRSRRRRADGRERPDVFRRLRDPLERVDGGAAGRRAVVMKANPMSKLPKAAQGTFDELLAGVEPDLAAIARRLRAMIRAVDASTVETVRLGDNAATYGVGPKKMTDGYAYIMPMRGYINLGFYQGAVLADPERLLEGTGKGLRHVKIRSLAEANRPPVRALMAAALARRRSGATGPARASTPRRPR